MDRSEHTEKNQKNKPGENGQAAGRGGEEPAVKRSTGVTVIAILLILGGGLESLASALSLALGPSLIARQREQMAAALDRLEQEGQGGQASPERVQRVAEIRQFFERFERTVQTSDGAARSLAAKAIGSLSGLLGIVALTAGIGILLLKGWARFLVIWQAGLSILCAIGTALWGYAVSLSAVEGLRAIGVAPGMQEMSLARGAAIGTVAMLLLPSLAWNGLLLWFFNRPSVKAQFQRTG